MGRPGKISALDIDTSLLPLSELVQSTHQTPAPFAPWGLCWYLSNQFLLRHEAIKP